MDEKTKKNIREQKRLFGQVVAELNGKYMDYETCRMLENFFSEYVDIVIASIGKEIRKALNNPKLMKALVKKWEDKTAP